MNSATAVFVDSNSDGDSSGWTDLCSELRFPRALAQVVLAENLQIVALVLRDILFIAFIFTH